MGTKAFGRGITIKVIVILALYWLVSGCALVKPHSTCEVQFNSITPDDSLYPLFQKFDIKDIDFISDSLIVFSGINRKSKESEIGTFNLRKQSFEIKYSVIDKNDKIHQISTTSNGKIAAIITQRKNRVFSKTDVVISHNIGQNWDTIRSGKREKGNCFLYGNNIFLLEKENEKYNFLQSRDGGSSFSEIKGFDQYKLVDITTICQRGSKVLGFARISFGKNSNCLFIFDLETNSLKSIPFFKEGFRTTIIEDQNKELFYCHQNKEVEFYGLKDGDLELIRKITIPKSDIIENILTGSNGHLTIFTLSLLKHSNKRMVYHSCDSGASWEASELVFKNPQIFVFQSHFYLKNLSGSVYRWPK